MVRLRKLRGGDSYIQQAQLVRYTHPSRDPNAMEVDKIKLTPSEKVEHMHN